MVKNLAQLKRTIHKGSRFVIVYHHKASCIGEERVVLQTNSVSFCSATEAQLKNGVPNDGKGIYMWYGAAKNWEFGDELCTVYKQNLPHTPENRIMSFRLLAQKN